MSRLDRRRARVAIAIGLAIAAIAAFLPAVTGGWIYDDHTLIADNVYVRSFAAASRWFTHDFWDVNAEVVRFGERMIYWRPLVTTSYAVDWQLGGGSPVVFHIINLLLHGGVAALAFLVLRRWSGATAPAAVAVLLYALHPTKAENVAWIAGRTDVLCMVFLLLAAQGMARRFRGQRFGLALEVLGTVGAYLCKEHAIVLFAFAAIEAWVAAGRPPLERAVCKRAVLASLPQAAFAIAYLGARALLLPLGSGDGASRPSLGHHAQAVLESLGRFITLTFAPHDLSTQQALVHLRNGEPIHSTPYVIIGAIGVALLVSAIVLLRKRWPIATVGLGFFLVALLPTSNLQYTEMRTLISDRFLYIPTFGIAFVAAGVLAALRGEWIRRGYALASACALALGSLAVARSADFSDEAGFWARERRLHPDSLEAHFFELRAAVAERKFQTARRMLGDIKAIQDGYDRIGWVDVFVAYQFAKITSRLVPDHDTQTLQAIDSFVEDLLAHEKPAATLSVRDISLTIPMQATYYPASVFKLAPQLLALRADINGRLDKDDQAIAMANEARKLCRTCVSGVLAAGLAYGRAGRYDDAFQTLDEVAGQIALKLIDGMREQLTKARSAAIASVAATGPAQLQARASELSSLELWGRAYAVLAPYKDPIKGAPSVATGFAELAFRAGDTAVAREVLLALGSADIDAQLVEWARDMGWAE